MAIQSTSDQQAMSEINVTPLVDVMLVLLIIFIVTMPLLNQAIKINLPKTVQTEPAPQEHILNVSVTGSGNIFFNNAPIVMSNLAQEFSTALQRDPELIVQFRVDDQVLYGTVAKIMAMAQKNGITKLSFVTEEEKQ